MNFKNDEKNRQIKGGCVTAVHFILFNFANYSPSIAMELKIGKKITCKWKKSEILDKQTCLLSIIFEVLSSNQLTLNSFQKP